MAMPTPIPALAPVERPLLDGAAEAVTVVVVIVEAVGVETGVPVAVGRPSVACLILCGQYRIAYSSC